MNKDLEIELLTKTKLRKAIEANKYWKKGNNPPFSLERAKWLLTNERIDEEDCCALIGLEQDVIVGYIFMLPDYINSSEKKDKIYWLILWWVADNYKDTIFGGYLFSTTLQATKNKAAVKLYAENVTDFYDKQPFTKILRYQRSTMFFGLDKAILIKKMPFIKYFTFALPALNYIVFKYVSFINKRKARKKSTTIITKRVTTVGNNLWGFIQPFCKNDLTLKTRSYINWQLDPMQSATGNFYLLDIKKNDNTIGFVAFVHRGREVYVKYFLCDKENFDTVAAALMNVLVTLKFNFVITDDLDLAEHFKKEYRLLFFHSQNKNGLAHNILIDKIDGLQLSQQDGHFT